MQGLPNQQWPQWKSLLSFVLFSYFHVSRLRAGLAGQADGPNPGTSGGSDTLHRQAAALELTGELGRVLKEDGIHTKRSRTLDKLRDIVNVKRILGRGLQFVERSTKDLGGGFAGA